MTGQLLTAEQAEAALQLDLQPDRPPSLTVEEQAALLALAAVYDSAGLAPGAVGWVPTYSERFLPYAVCRGLQAKAAKVAGLLTFTADGATHNAGELAAQLRAQADAVAKRMNGTGGGSGLGS